MRPESELVQSLERAWRDDAGCTRVFHYGLYRENTPARNGFHYIRCHMEVWHGQKLAAESLDFAGGLGMDESLARSVFARLVQAEEPVSPVHLADVVRDQVVEFHSRWSAEDFPVAARDSA